MLFTLQQLSTAPPHHLKWNLTLRVAAKLATLHLAEAQLLTSVMNSDAATSMPILTLPV